MAAAAGEGAAEALGAWGALLRWARERGAGAGPGRVDRVALLEECLRGVGRAEELREDPALLGVYLEYADLVPNPAQVFQFMEANRVGLEFAKFYEARARFLEARGNVRGALGVFEAGIAKMAFPVERLRRKARELQLRVAAGGLPETAEEDGGPDENGAVRRPFMAAAGGGLPFAATGSGGGGAQPQVQPQAQAQPRAQPQAQPARLRAGGAGPCGLAIYEDGEVGGDEAGGAERRPLGEREAEAVFAALPTQREGSKENTAQATGWKEGALGGGGRRAAAAALDISIDPEFSEGSRVKINSRAKSQLAATRIKGADGKDLSFEEARYEDWLKR